MKKFTIIFSLTAIFFISFVQAAQACFLAPRFVYMLSDGSQGSSIVVDFDKINPYFAGETIVACAPAPLNFKPGYIEDVAGLENDDFMDKYFFDIQNPEYCSNGDIIAEKLTSVKIGGKVVEYRVESRDIGFHTFTGYAETAEENPTHDVLIIDNIAFNNVSKEISINNELFTYMYDEGVIPSYLLSLILIPLVIIFLLLNKKNLIIKSAGIISAIIITVLSLVIINFDYQYICSGSSAPSFLGVGLFSLWSIIFFVANLFPLHKIIRTVLIGVYIFSSLVYLAYIMGVWGTSWIS